MPKRVASEQDWLIQGLAAFAEGGEGALVVERLARMLGASKTSFYWYFKDRETFIERIVDYWERQYTASIIDRNEQSALQPAEAITALLGEMFGTNAGKNFMFYFRQLGEREAGYALRLERIERQRLHYFAGLLAGCGKSREEAEGGAELVYCYYLGWHERYKTHKLDGEHTELQVQRLLHYLKINSEEE